jgi:hypothetical protein
MKVHIQGFPTEVSRPYELPDIGELLMFPHFQGIGAEDFRCYATEFQKYLLDQLPLTNLRKNLLVRWGVWLLEPGTRSHVSGTGEWHIDGIGDQDHLCPQERVHILSSPCQALTEFNAFPLEIDSNPAETRLQFTERLRKDPSSFGIIGRAIEPCRLYTFENHLHRAVDPQRIEFRFFLRVRETDEAPFTKEPIKTVKLSDVANRAERSHIVYGRDGVLVRYPRSLAPSA